MDMLTILLLFIIIVLILSHQQKLLKHFDRLEEEIRQLRDQIGKTALPPVKPIETPVEPAKPAAFTRPPPPVGPPAPSGPPAAAGSPAPASSHASVGPSGPPPVRENPVIPLATPKPAAQKSFVLPEQQAGKKRFFERHPDLEKFIGENLISKIGIAILVLAIGFFVKYAIDNDWIGPVGRVGIGLLCGGILVWVAHILRKSYAAFSSVLVGGGLAVFYFTIALAYHQYQLFSQTTSFIFMLIITAFAVILSILYDRQELAVIALVGGFVTPFLVSNGSGNYKILFSYLLILNTGLLVIAYNKAWRLLNLLAFLFTSVIFISWLADLSYDTGMDVYRGGFLFATAFYILFFVINIAHTIRENKKFIASDFGILLINTCFYFAMGLWLLAEMNMNNYRGLFSASMGVFNLAGSYFLLRTKKVDSNILYLLIGITLSFVSLTAPLQLHGHYITLFWGSETVLLYWLSQRSGIRIIRWAAMLVWLGMLVSLMMDWAATYVIYARIPPTHLLPVVFNKGFMTGLYSALSCYALFFLLRKEEGGAPPEDGARQVMGQAATKMDWNGVSGWRIAFLLAGALILFTTGALEIDYQFASRYPGTELGTLYLLLYSFCYISLLTFLGDRLRWFASSWTSPGLLVACIVIYLCWIPDSFKIQREMLEGGHYAQHFIAHWFSALLVATILWRLIALRTRRGMVVDPVIYTWIMCILVVTFLSSEIQLLMNACFYSDAYPLPVIQQVYYKTGLPILWGLCSFAFMWLGMRHKFKPLRIISLVLFSVTLLKLFLFDIRNIPIAGKIAAFFCLGVLLLVVSFMYQRLKKIIVEDEEKKPI